MIAYKLGMYDVLRGKDLRELDRNIQLSKEEGNDAFALGIYSEELCEALGINKPLKTLEERMDIARNLRGIDIVFPVYSLDPKIVRKNLKEEILSKQEKSMKEEMKKEFDLAYAPGTYDLFHAGHLENLLEASKRSKRLIVGVKADELVQKHKNRAPIISAEERMEILRHFRFVNDVYIYYTRDLHIANEWIKSKQNKGFDAVFLGSDLKADFKDVKGINIIYTERDSEKMKVRSTTSYAKKFKTLSLDKDSNYNLTGKIDLVDKIRNCQKKEQRNKEVNERI